MILVLIFANYNNPVLHCGSFVHRCVHHLKQTVSVVSEQKWSECFCAHGRSDMCSAGVLLSLQAGTDEISVKGERRNNESERGRERESVHVRGCSARGWSLASGGIPSNSLSISPSLISERWRRWTCLCCPAFSSHSVFVLEYSERQEVRWIGVCVCVCEELKHTHWSRPREGWFCRRFSSECVSPGQPRHEPDQPRLLLNAQLLRKCVCVCVTEALFLRRKREWCWWCLS